MANQSNTLTRKEQVQQVATKTFRIARIVVVSVVVILAVVGGYVVSQPQLRNATINYAQNESPKGQ